MLLLLLLCPTRFRIFLSSMFYIGNGTGRREAMHLTEVYRLGLQGGNPRKQDAIEGVVRRGAAVEIHQWAAGAGKQQARYLEALALRATRLAGNVTNLKEEKVRVPPGCRGMTPFAQQLAGTLVLWEMSATLGLATRATVPTTGRPCTPPAWTAAANHSARMSVTDAAAKDAMYTARLYTRQEDLEILDFIATTGQHLAAVEGDARCVKGGCRKKGIRFGCHNSSLWKGMRELGVAKGARGLRSWQNLRQRFMQKILKQLPSYSLPPEELERFAAALQEVKVWRSGVEGEKRRGMQGEINSVLSAVDLVLKRGAGST